MIFKNDYRMQGNAVKALQAASEMYLVQLFEDANLCTFHRRRVTLSDRDMAIVLTLRGPTDPGFH